MFEIVRSRVLSKTACSRLSRMRSSSSTAMRRPICAFARASNTGMFIGLAIKSFAPAASASAMMSCSPIAVAMMTGRCS